MLMKTIEDFEETVEVAVQAELDVQEAAALSNEQVASEINEVMRS